MTGNALICWFLLYCASGSLVVFPGGDKLLGKTVVSTDLRLSHGVNKIDQYIGIPFAQPPIGPLRFRGPKSFRFPTPGTRNFTEPRKPCYVGKDGSDKDCLYLNVFRPSSARPNSNLPVMVWFYGGGFTGGRVDIYDGTELAIRNNVIVVVPAYRLGMLGCM